MKIPSWIKNLYFRYCISVKKGKCLFIPHPGFTEMDRASIINYKADNCLIFVRYLLEHELCLDKELVVVSTTPERAQKEQEWCKERYPKANIRFIPNISRPFKTAWASSEYIISSESRFQYLKKKGQKYIVLGYFPIALKNDWFSSDENSKDKNHTKYASEIDKISSGSLIFSQMDSSAYEISFGKYMNIGKVRSDVMLEKEDVTYVREYFKELCGDYEFSRIILYTPTHRDYEASVFDMKRSILGFDVDKDKFKDFLKTKKLLIVCKLHPKQNAEVVDSDLPEGVVRFTGHNEFGLVELMKASDILMTDYTSAYVDYLLLNKPVVFNFYDLQLYDRIRGLSFHPFDRICAGEVFTNESTFYKAICEVIKNPNKYEQMRKDLLEYLCTYRKDVCANTYKAIFEE